MSYVDHEQRPAKKRRFFIEEPETPGKPQSPSEPANPDGVSGIENVKEGSLPTTVNGASDSAFDVQLLEGIIGEPLSNDVVGKLRSLSEDNVERAINVYFDGSWKKTINTASSLTVPNASTQTNQNGSISSATAPDTTADAARPTTEEKRASDSPRPTQTSMPDKRYVGAFGVVCWATRSGINLIKSNDQVNIERSKVQPSVKVARGGKAVATGKRQDNIVRFTNQRHEEIGRLETDSAAWIAPLLDQHVCHFEGQCVFAPDRVRSNDTIYLQLRCCMLKKTFDAVAFVKQSEANRPTGLFEAKESQAERDLHLKQAALVRLFNEINLTPSKTNAATEKHKRKGLLQATDVAERYDDKRKSSTPAENGGSSPPSEDAEDGKELEQDQLDTLYRKAQTFDFNTPEQEPTDTFAMELRQYQKQALHWMAGKENDQKDARKELTMHPLWEEYKWPLKDVDDNELPLVEGCDAFYVNPYSGELSLNFPVQEQNCLGGVLADEMGLGKTIEMLSLMHSQRSEVAQSITNAPPSNVNSLPRLPKSSSTIEPAPCTTLVVAPMSLLAQWQSEAEKASTPNSLKVLMYYGTDRSLNLRNICCAANASSAPNLLITSYGTVLSEFGQIASNSNTDRTSHGGLFSLDYYRVILDEAHHIKNRQSKTAKACYEIAAKHRWVLTGTPIVNRLEDLFSLVHFLRVEPWSNFSYWKTFITVPFESGDHVKALDVVQTVLEPLVLRRTKDMKTPSGEALVPLPSRTIEIQRVELSKDEREVYDLIYARAKRAFSANIEAGTLLKSYTTIFAQILRLRQSCCHPILTRNKTIVAEEEEAAAASDVANGLADDMDLQALIERFTVEDAEGEQDANKFGAHALQHIQEEKESECPICSEEPMVEQSVTGCWHSACKACLMGYIDHQRDKLNELPKCFNCRAPINARDVFEVVRHEEDDRDDKPETRIALRRLTSSSTSAKLSALLTHLKTQRTSNPNAKSVVFSQFTSFLDLIEPLLTSARIPYLRFDGSMSQKLRASVLTTFSSEDRAGTVLLLSLRAGGVGLNLTAATRVYMMDPWWSWAVEAQAIDRVHRMGQTEAVGVVRFVVAESIEEKMLRIQERKKFLASSLGMMSEEEKRVQRLEDIKELLS